MYYICRVNKIKNEKIMTSQKESPAWVNRLHNKKALLLTLDNTVENTVLVSWYNISWTKLFITSLLISYNSTYFRKIEANKDISYIFISDTMFDRAFSSNLPIPNVYLGRLDKSSSICLNQHNQHSLS